MSLKYHRQNGIYSTCFRLLNKVKTKLSGKPRWATQPTSLQLDTTNKRCPLDCVYCNPQNVFAKSGTGDLSLKTMEHVMDEIVKNQIIINNFYPFMNSDPQRELRLPKITKMAKKKLHSVILISTGGVLPSKRHLLVDDNINDVCFSVSAASPELYLKVHRKPYFGRAVSTIEWFKKNKSHKQRIGMRYILFEGNVHELEKWQMMFSDLPQEIRCLHSGGDRSQSNILSAHNQIIETYQRLKTQTLITTESPCNCFGNLAISFDGKIMQCCDLPYEHNWGHVEEVDLMEVWNKRLDLGLNHKGCVGCSQVNPRWKELFEKYVWG